MVARWNFSSSHPRILAFSALPFLPLKENCRYIYVQIHIDSDEKTLGQQVCAGPPGAPCVLARLMTKLISN